MTARAGRPARLPRRLRAAATDVVVLLPWVVAAGAVGLVLRAVDTVPTTPVGQDALAFVSLVLPVTVTTGLLEAGRGTPGKRRAGLAVVDAEGRPVGSGRALARSAVRFLPWQLAHTAVFHLLAGSTSPAWFVVSGAAQVAVVGSWALVAVDGRALHDRVTGTRVVWWGPDDGA